MNVTHWDPLDELTSLCEAVNLGGGGIGGAATWRQAQMPNWMPRVEVFETEEEVVLRATMPGMDPKTLRVDVSAHSVLIEGETRPEGDPHGRRYQWRELRYGLFRRRVILPWRVDPGTAGATYKHGLLEVRASKTRKALGR
jgi:HSP20 family protein